MHEVARAVTEPRKVAVAKSIPAVAIVSAAPVARVIAQRLAVEHIAKPFEPLQRAG